MRSSHTGHLVLTIVAIGCAFLLLQAMEGAEALPNDPLRSVEIVFDEEVGALRPTNNEPGVCDIGGKVTVEKPSGADRVLVNLTVWASNNWTVSISPTSLTFEEAGTKTFIASVFVPAKTNASLPEDRDQLSVLAMAYSPLWHGDDTAFADLVVDQYFSIAVSSSKQTMRGRPGHEIRGNIGIKNEGNGHDTLLVEIVEGGEYIYDEDFQSTVGMREFYGTGLEYSFIVDDDIDPSLYGKTVTIKFRIRSLKAMDAGLVVQDTYTVSVYIMSEAEQASYITWEYVAQAALLTGCVIAPIALFLVVRRRRAFARRVAEIREAAGLDQDAGPANGSMENG